VTLGPWQWALVALAAAAIAWAAVVGALALVGRRAQARALAAFLPDCLILLRRLLSDPRVPRRRKAAVAVVAAYLALPFDLVPDFIPVLGQVDDALAVIVVLRYVLRSGGGTLIEELWPGPPESLGVVLRVAGAGRHSAARHGK
jgi:uncharacterized membrane protein YkvA (DUF1232 family)